MKEASQALSPLAKVTAKALEVGAQELEVEYKSGWEEVCAMRGNFGVGIARFKASSEEGSGLREQLWEISKKPARIDILGTTYRVRARRFDSFGEVAFRVTIDAAQPRHAAGGKPRRR